MRVDHVEIDDPVVRLHWENGQFNEFHFLWLRDNDPVMTLENGQKVCDPKQIAIDVAIKSAAIDHAENALLLDWQDNAREQTFDLCWLYDHRYSDEGLPHVASNHYCWGAKDARHIPELPYSQIISNADTLCQFLEGVDKFGIAFATEMPENPDALLSLVNTFGFVRETNYGKTFDVRTVANAENLAYTSMGLPVHTDNPYRDPVPSLQCLQVLRNEAEGGDSLFVDGFSVAEELKRQSMAAFDLLASHKVTFRYRSADADLIRSAPILDVEDGIVSAINFNSRSMQPLRLPNDKILGFYDAYRQFARLLESKEFCIHRKLPSGTAVLFHNLRVLHGRTAFQNGERHLRGCYADIDGLLSQLRVLQRETME